MLEEKKNYCMYILYTHKSTNANKAFVSNIVYKQVFFYIYFLSNNLINKYNKNICVCV